MSHPVDIDSLPLLTGSTDRRRGVDGAGRHAAWQREMERAQLASWFVGNSSATGNASVDASRVDTRPSPSFRPEQSLPTSASVATRNVAGSESGASDAAAYPVAATAMRTDPGGGLAATGGAVETSDRVHGEAAEPPPVRAIEARVDGTASPPASTKDIAGARSAEAGRVDAIFSPVPVVTPQVALSSYARNRLSATGESPEASSVHETVWTLGAERDRLRFHAQWADDGVVVWLGLEGDAETTRNRLASLVAGLRQVLDEQEQRLKRVICNGSIVYEEEMAGSMPAANGSGADDARRLISRFNPVFKTQEEKWQSVR